MSEVERFDASSVFTRRQALIGGGAMALSASALLSACGSNASTSTSAGAGIGNGLVYKSFSQLKPFQPSSAVGAKPNLPKRLFLVIPTSAEIWTLFAEGAAKGCEDRGLDFAQANAQGDVAQSEADIRTARQRGVGGLCLVPVDPKAQRATAIDALKAGLMVTGVSTAPADLQFDADQYRIGKMQGDAAVAWIKQHLGGKATVANFNEDALNAVLIPRHHGVKDALNALGSGLTLHDQGIPAVSDDSPAGGYKLTSTLLQAHPDVQVILGTDTMMLGAANAVKASGSQSVRYIGGIDGEQVVLKEIMKGGLINATVGVGWKMLGYAAAQFTADWLEGKAIPQVSNVTPLVLDSPAAIDTLEAEDNNPASSWNSPKYQTFLGSVSYEKRQNWLQNAIG